MQSLELLDEFIALADSGRLFLSMDKAWNSDFRQGLGKAVGELLFHQRAELERSRGIDWVYGIFRDRLALFEKIAGGDSEDGAAMEAKLFLAMLPFPGQWSWLERLAAEYGYLPEVAAFFHHERRVIRKKIEKKSYKRFRLRNFCQILKPHGLPREKGVLRIFSIPYFFPLVPELLETIGRHYVLYVEPAAGITFRHTWMRYFSHLKDPVLFGLSSSEDRDFVLGQPNTAATHLAHGDYLDARTQVPLHGEVRFDIVFNNTFDERDRKRHSLMLDLMDHPGLQNVRVLFMGRGTPDTVADFKSEIEKRGLGTRTTVLANLLRSQVAEHLAHCRMGVHLALMENGCRAVYEYFRSDLPCVMSTATAGMDPSIITPETGILATDGDLPGAIRRVLDRERDFFPRRWFLEKSGCFNATEQLNAQLKTLFHSQGYDWQEDIVTMTSSGVGRYADPRDLERFAPDFERLAALFRNIPDLPIRLDAG
ncbi:MAG: glycosyltransferase [Desulfobacterium sp.]|nr:glycosyltransferase [Desulfobacterium sp.]